MPNYKGHIAGGVAAFLVTASICRLFCEPSAVTLFEWMLFSIAGALFPDVDIKSKGQRYGYWIIACLLVILLVRQRYRMLMTVSSLAMLPMLSRHRGLFHRLWFIVFCACAVWYLISMEFPAVSNLFMYNVIFFVAGAFSHLWLDRGLRRAFEW